MASKNFSTKKILFQENFDKWKNDKSFSFQDENLHATICNHHIKTKW